MQDKLISLDPSHADSSARQSRVEVFNQRTLEAQGGHAAVQLQTVTGVTAGYLAYMYYRGNGFRMFPLAANKAPKYVAIGMTFLMTHTVFKAYAMGQLGDAEQYNYLLSNKGAILSGNASFEKN